MSDWFDQQAEEHLFPTDEMWWEHEMLEEWDEEDAEAVAWEQTQREPDDSHLDREYEERFEIDIDY